MLISTSFITKHLLKNLCRLVKVVEIFKIIFDDFELILGISLQNYVKVETSKTLF